MLPRRDSKPLEYPALLPMFGGIEKKLRFLDREVITMGRARGSDICLDGNEVSALHCIIYRSTEGFRVRDCGSRTGTRVNGQGVKTNVLGNGDVLQIGPFSFEVRLPKGMSQVAAIDPFRFERMRRSRSKLGQLALALRKKLRLKKTPPNGQGIGTAHESPALADSNTNDKKLAELKAKIKQYDQKVNQLEASEKELGDELEALKTQKREFEEQCQAREAAIAERQKRLEEEVQKRCAAGQANEDVPSAPSVDHGQEAHDLQGKRQELEALERKLQARDKELNDDYKEISKEREQVEKLKQQWQNEQIEAQKLSEQQRTAIASAEATLHEQKAQLGAMIDQLRKMQDDLRMASSGETNQLKEQIAQLKKELAEAQVQSSNDAGAQGEVAQLLEKLAASQANVESLSLSLKQSSGLSAEVEELQKKMQARQAQLEEHVQSLLAENEALRRQGSEGAAAAALSINGDQEARLAQLQSENESLRGLAEQLQQHFAAADPGAHTEELAALKSEIEALRDQLQKAEQPPQTASGDSEEVRQENKILRRLLDEAEADLRQLKNDVGGGKEAGASTAESAALQSELQALRDQLSQKDVLIGELKDEAKSHPIGDPESYEAELNRFRKELEADRARLNKEIESLRLRNSELDDATRELEMELSRERAEMARERIRLDRMRDEVKADMERLQREHDVRGTLGSVQKLREEIVQKAGGPPKNAADRLRSMSKLPQ